MLSNYAESSKLNICVFLGCMKRKKKCLPKMFKISDTFIYTPQNDFKCNIDMELFIKNDKKFSRILNIYLFIYLLTVVNSPN